MIETLFTSDKGGDPLRDRLLALIEEAARVGRSHRVDIHSFAFSFTDRLVADLIDDVTSSCPNLSVRILADWGQGAGLGGRRVGQGRARSEGRVHDGRRGQHVEQALHHLVLRSFVGTG